MQVGLLEVTVVLLTEQPFYAGYLLEDAVLESVLLVDVMVETLYLEAVQVVHEGTLPGLLLEGTQVQTLPVVHQVLTDFLQEGQHDFLLQVSEDEVELGQNALLEVGIGDGVSGVECLLDEHEDALLLVSLLLLYPPGWLVVYLLLGVS